MRWSDKPGAAGAIDATCVDRRTFLRGVVGAAACSLAGDALGQLGDPTKTALGDGERDSGLPPQSAAEARVALVKAPNELERAVVAGWEQYYLTNYYGPGSADQLWRDVLNTIDGYAKANGVEAMDKLIEGFAAFRKHLDEPARPPFDEAAWRKYAEENPEAAKIEPAVVLASGKACHALGMLALTFGDFEAAEPCFTLAEQSSYNFPGVTQTSSQFVCRPPTTAIAHSREVNGILRPLREKESYFEINDDGSRPILRVYYDEESPQAYGPTCLRMLQENVAAAWQQALQFYYGDLDARALRQVAYKTRGFNLVFLRDQALRAKLASAIEPSRRGLSSASTSRGSSTLVQENLSQDKLLSQQDGAPLGQWLRTWLVHDLWGLEGQCRHLPNGAMLPRTLSEGFAQSLAMYTSLPGHPEDFGQAYFQRCMSEAFRLNEPMSIEQASSGRRGGIGQGQGSDQVTSALAGLHAIALDVLATQSGRHPAWCRRALMTALNDPRSGFSFENIYGMSIEESWQLVFFDPDWAISLRNAVYEHMRWQ